MPLLIQCPNCKKLLGPDKKECRSKTGKGCGRPLPHGRKIYYIQWRVDGKNKQKKIGLSKTAAKNELAKIEVAVTEGRYIDKAKEAPKVKIGDFIDQEYLPWCKSYNRGSGYRNKKVYTAHIKEQWGSKHLDELTDKDVDRYRWQLQKAEKTVTFNRVLSTLSHMYTIAIEYGRVSKRPFTTAKKRFKEKPRLRYLLPDEARKLVDACADHLRPIVLVALHTGMRKGEILGLRLGDNVDITERRITLKETKTDEVRHVLMNNTVLALMADLAEDMKEGDYFFPGNVAGQPVKEIKRSWAAALKVAGIEDFRFHDLRHTFASNLVMQRIDLATVQELMGHKDIKMTLKYSHLSPDHQQKAVGVLDELFGQDRAGGETELKSNGGTR